MIIVDTGVIVAATVPGDQYHVACSRFLIDARAQGELLLLPATVAAEAGYLISEVYGGVDLEISFLQSVARGSFQPVELLAEDYARMAVLAGKYADFPLGTTDASIIAIAERLGVKDIATLDRRHFTAVRPNHISAFRLLPVEI